MTKENHLKLFGDGLYDLHITVDETQLYNVMLFARINKINLAFAVGNKGKYYRQLMTSQHIQGSATSVLQEANKMVEKMNHAGIRVLRVKIEAMANPPTMRQAMVEFMATEEFLQNIKYSYEFHYKVSIDSMEQQRKLEELCEMHSVSYAANALSKKPEKFPLISQRVRGDYDDALDQREMFQKLLKKNDIPCLLDGTHYEAIIYDTNYALDEGFVPDPINV